MRGLSAPQRCNAERSDAQRRFLATQVISPFLQRHRCDALPCFSASPVIIFHIAHIAFPPLLPFFLSPQWFTVQNNKKFTKSHNAAMLPLATRDGHRKRKRKRSDAVWGMRGLEDQYHCQGSLLFTSTWGVSRLCSALPIEVPWHQRNRLSDVSAGKI